MLESTQARGERLQRRQRLHHERCVSGRHLHWDRSGRLHGERSLPRRRNLRSRDRCMLEPESARRESLQRRQRVHPGRYLSRRGMWRRRPRKLFGQPVPQCGHVRPATGTCSGPASPDGTGCDDGNLCTTNDTCANGICVGAPACGDTCTACHTSCDPATGQCTFGIAPDGTACGGAATPDECHQPGTCQHGICTGTALSDGSPCGAAPAGDSCLQPATCQGGRCVQSSGAGL